MLSFATLQWKDPDRLIWIGIYFATSLLALIAYTYICKSCIQGWATMLSIITLLILIQVFPGVIIYFQVSNYGEIITSMTEDKSYIEQVREFIGLLIVLIYCTHIAAQVHKK